MRQVTDRRIILLPADVLKTPDMIEKLTTFGSMSAPNSPAEFDAIIKSDTERYGKVLKDAGVAVN